MEGIRLGTEICRNVPFRKGRRDEFFGPGRAVVGDPALDLPPAPV